MKVDLPLQAPESVDFPPYLPWVFSSILLPCPLYIITTAPVPGLAADGRHPVALPALHHHDRGRGRGAERATE